MRRTANETRLIIFTACTQILVRDGLPTLTLATVAAEAGLSKGGLLYHFPSKVALVEALFTHHLDEFDNNIQSKLNASQDRRPGRWLRAYAEASVDQIINLNTASVFASLFAAGERYPSVLQIMRDRYVVWQRCIDQDGLSPEWAVLFRLIVDGLWFAQLYQFSPPDPALRDHIFTLLATLIEQANEDK